MTQGTASNPTANRRSDPADPQDLGSPLALGPMWDYNEAFGLCCGFPITVGPGGGMMYDREHVECEGVLSEWFRSDVFRRLGLRMRSASHLYDQVRTW